MEGKPKNAITSNSQDYEIRTKRTRPIKLKPKLFPDFVLQAKRILHDPDFYWQNKRKYSDHLYTRSIEPVLNIPQTKFADTIS